MIFKTITSSVDETRKTLTLFNKDWNTYKTNWQNSNGFFGKIGSVFSTASSPISSSDLEAIKAYNSQIDDCVTSQTAFNRTMLNASPAAQNLVASFNGGKVSAEAMANAQNAVKASTIGLTIAQTALNAAIGMGIGLLISALINGINKLIHANEEAIEKAEELRRKYEEFKSTNQENIKTLEGLDEEFKELSKGVSQYGDNISLTTEQYQRYKEIIQQIVGMSPSLSEGYSTENGYIADKNGLLERAIELQKQEYRNELRKVTNLDNLKTSMSGYIAEYKEAFGKGFVTDDMSVTMTKTADDFYNTLWNAFNVGDRDNYNEESFARDILKTLGVDNIDKEMENFFNKHGYFQSKWFFEDYADTIAENIQTVKDSINADDVGLDDTIFDQNIVKLDSVAQSYTDMKDAISLANESIQTDLGYIAEYADGYSDLSTEQQKFVSEYLKGFNISNITSRDWFGNMVFDENKMASVKSQITKFVEKLSQNESTKKALKDLYAVPTDDQSVADFISQFRNALEIIKSYCKENGIEIPIAISDDEQAINDLEEQYQRTIDFTEKKFKGYNATNFFTNNSINTQEEIDKWLEIAQAANSASEAEKQYLNQDVDSSLLSLEEAQKAVNGFKEGDTEIIGLIDELSLLQEVLSDTGNIQEETYEKLLSCSAKYATAIRTENGRITVNTSKLKAVAKSRQLDTKEAIKQTLALKKQEWVQWNNGIENYNGTLLENIENTYGDIDALQSQITQYELLANSVDNASNAFENFKNAQSTEDQDMYNTAQDAFDVLKGYSSDPENENFGKYNRDEFQEAAMLLMDNDTYKKSLNAKDLDEYQKVVESFVKSIEPLFDEKNYNSAKNLFDRINEIMDSGNVPEADIDWAKRLGISKEMFHALSQFGNQYDFEHKEIFESYQLNTLDEYQSLLSNVKTAQEALNECTEKTGNKYDYLSMELDEAKRKYSEFKNETADTLEDAYDDYIHSGAKSKGDFTEYLKQNLDFDDSDVTGSIDVLLDKANTVKENLENMPPDSEAYELYKKQLEEINTLLDSLDFDMDSIDKTKSLDDKISQYKELVEEAEKYKKTLESEDSGSDSYKEAAQELERISGLMANLRDPLRLEINSNIAEIDSQISQLDEKLNGLKESLQHASTSTEAHTIHMDIKGAENEKAKLEGQKEELQQTLKIIVDSTEVDEYDPEEKEGTVKYSPDFTAVTNATPPVLKGKIEYEAKLPNQPTTPTSPTTKADGTFNAFAQGTGSDVSIPKDEKALVNELGEEGVVCFYATLCSDAYEKFYLIAGNPLEPYKLQRNDETGISAKV